MAIRLVDLSQEIYQGMPVYPGHLKTAVWEYHSHEETRRSLQTGFSYATRGLLLSDHGPTHVDAINHVDPAPGAQSIDQLPLEFFYTSAVCIDVSHVSSHEYLTVEVLSLACQRNDLEIRKGDTVLLYTAHWDRNYGTDKWLTEYTGLDRAATEWLAQRGVVNIGIDAPSIDNPMDRSYPAHTVCREQGILNTENLANLKMVRAKRFRYAGFPLRIRGGTGSPVRAVAILED